MDNKSYCFKCKYVSGGGYYCEFTNKYTGVVDERIPVKEINSEGNCVNFKKKFFSF